MTSRDIVKNKYPVAQVHKRLTDSHYEIWQDGKKYPMPNRLAEGETEEIAWINAADIVQWWQVDRREEIMNGLIKQLTGHDERK